MAQQKFAPWTAVHLSLLLYLAWQHNGKYKKIEQAWAVLAPDSKRTLRAIEEKLRSIPKDVNAVGLQKYFETGAPTRRKSEKSVDGRLVVKAKNRANHLPAKQRSLALPAPNQSMNLPESNGATEYDVDVDAIAIPFARGDAATHTSMTRDDFMILRETPSSRFEIKKEPDQASRQQHDYSSQQTCFPVPDIVDDDVIEVIDMMPGPSTKRKFDEYKEEEPVIRPARRLFRYEWDE